jgi:DNA (cytosine-5)-methyltransferase 1
MRVGSLFAGIGGFDLGLERAGFSTAWFCEQDAFCQKVLAKHWPGVPVYDDICKMKGADVEPVDILCGGFPCQDLSYAGKGAGLAGARSGLWTEYARLIGELGPRYVIVENVSALLARGLGTVLGDLAALGYDAEWDCIPASAVGAPHRRDRIWLVAYPHGADRKARRSDGLGIGPQSESGPLGSEGGADRDGNVADPESLAERPGLRQDESAGERGRRPCDGSSSSVLADTLRSRGPAGLSTPGHGEEGNTEKPVDGCDRRGWGPGSSQWATEPDVGRVAHGVPARVDRLRALGNALVPQIAEWIGWRIREWEGEGQ